MHLLKDENGNLIPHGADHEHSLEHAHTHTHEHTNESQDKSAALLQYMYVHNRHHADELEQMLIKLESSISNEAKEAIRDAVSDFRQGNEKLGLALELMQEGMAPLENI